MEKIKIEGVESASVRVSNAADESRKVRIEAVANFQKDGGVQSVSNGEVREDGRDYPVASFDQYGEDNLNVRWNQKSESMSRTEMLAEIEAFIAAVGEENPVKELLNV